MTARTWRCGASLEPLEELAALARAIAIAA